MVLPVATSTIQFHLGNKATFYRYAGKTRLEIMSESTSMFKWAIFLIGNLFSFYYAFRLLRELYHYLTKKEEDFL
jgi:hypothetical protein